MVKEKINLMYKDLVALLGELHLQQHSINAKIDSIKSKIEALDSLVPTLEKIESEINKGVKND